MSFQQLTYEVSERIATITLNRPEKLNAFTSRMVHEFCGALDEADADDEVRAVIVTGAGRAFCAGADMSEGGTTFTKTSQPMPPTGSVDEYPTGERSSRSDHDGKRGMSTGSVDNNAGMSTGSVDNNAGMSTGSVDEYPTGERSSRSDHDGKRGMSTGSVDNNAGMSTGSVDKRRDGGGIVSLRIFRSLKPIIAAVNGPAVGVGSTMLLPMDIRLASTEARFGFVFTQRGIVPEAASSWFLPRVVGISQALEWSLLGDVFEADEALSGGLVRSLHEPDDLIPAARAIASRLAERTSAVSVAMARQQLWRMLGESHPMAAHRIESAAVPQLGGAADAIEGVTSFLEKRPAEFTLGVANDMPPIYPWFVDPPFNESET